MSNQRSRHKYILTALFSSLVAFVVAGMMVAPAAAQDNVISALYLPMVSTEDEPAPGGRSSETLIEEARQTGKIDAETALLYRVYASFEDARLPAEYRGDDSNSAPSLAMYQVHAQWATLAPATQAALAPFLRSPMAPDSWLELQAAAEPQVVNAPSQPQEANAANRIVWFSTCQTDSNIKVWYQERYPDDADDARAICELVSGTIWPRLKSLLGRQPLDDSGQSNNGGDGQLDIYLVKAKTAALPYAGCFNSPSYILVNNQKWSPAEIVEVVMSAFLSSYLADDCAEYLWLFAASRTWAIDYVLPSDNYEHGYADDFLNHTDLSLNTYPLVPLGVDNAIGDGAYLWLWYLTNFVGSAKEIIPVIWENATSPDSLEVMNGAVSGGFAKHWADFSQQNWNNVPVETYFATDQLLYSTKPKLEAEVTLNGDPDLSYALDGKVKYLAAHTYHFTFNDPAVRSLLFINPFHDNTSPTARVNAIYKLEDGQWVMEEWTDKYSKAFCRDLKTERIVDLTVVISNHEWKDRTHALKPAYPPRLNATNMGCRGWNFEGTSTLTRVGKEVNASETTTVTARYTRLPINDGSNSHPSTIYYVTEGSGSWSHRGTSYKCTANGKGSYELSGSFQTILFVFNHATDHGTATTYAPDDRRYVGYGTEGLPNLNTLKVTYTCPSGQKDEALVATAARWFLTEELPTQQADRNGTTITGQYTTRDDTAGVVTTTIYKWTMTALPPE